MRHREEHVSGSSTAALCGVVIVFCRNTMTSVMFLEEHHQQRRTVSYGSTEHRFFEPVLSTCLSRLLAVFRVQRPGSPCGMRGGVPRVPWYPGYHGRWYTSPTTPGGNILGCQNRLFWTKEPYSLGASKGRKPENSGKTVVFRGPVRVLLCHQGTRPRIRSRIRGFPDPAPNKTESISVTFDGTEAPGKGHFPGQKPIRTTQ